MKMTYMLLTDKERRTIKRWRGSRLTGQPHHTEVFADDTSRTYFWPWGSQPNGDLLQLLCSKDPIRAANKYLALFEPSTSGPGNSSNPPKRRLS